MTRRQDETQVKRFDGSVFDDSLSVVPFSKFTLLVYCCSHKKTY